MRRFRGSALSKYVTAAAVTLAFLSADASAAPFTVYDSQGKEVGPLVQIGFVGLSIYNTPIVVAITDPTGFYERSSSLIYFYHKTANCSGQRYLIATQIPDEGFVNNQHLYFAGMPAASIASQSYEGYSQGADVAMPGLCFHNSVDIFAGPVKTHSVSTLGFTPPFSVK